MMSEGSVPYHQGGNQTVNVDNYGPEQPGGQRRPPLPNVGLSPDEVRVLRGCNRESFWQRCVPISIGMMIGVRTLINRGVLSSSPFGNYAKYTVAGFLGYFAGKLSYQGKCKQKILQLENSHLADMIRSGKSRSYYNMLPDVSQSDPEHSETSTPRSSQVPSEYDKDKYQGLDERFRPSLDSEQIQRKPEEKKVQQYTSYEELKRQNRQVYEQKPGNQRIPPPVSISPPADRNSRPFPIRPNNEGKPKNVYGDVMED